MGYYDIDHGVLVKWLLPVRLRKAVHKAFLNALIAPVVYLYTLFTTFRGGNLYDLNHNGQVAKLEAVLNDGLDTGAPDVIYISDYLYAVPVYVYLRAERKPLYLYARSEHSPVFLWRRSELVTGTFIVNVGIALADETLLRSLLDKYKLAGTRYIIRYY